MADAFRLDNCFPTRPLACDYSDIRDPTATLRIGSSESVAAPGSGGTNDLPLPLFLIWWTFLGSCG